MTSLKTEHSGAKKGQGAYWGHKREAKVASKKKRRLNGKAEVRKAERLTVVSRQPTK
jgi:hypothetical protein